MRLLAAERFEVGVRCCSCKHISKGDPPHRDVGNQRTTVGVGNRNRDRVRPGERRAPVGVRQPSGRGCRENGNEAALGEPPRPVTENARREAGRRHDQPHAIWWVRKLRVAHRGKRQVTERSPAIPALERRLCNDALGCSRRVVPVPLGEMLDTDDPVAALPPTLGVEEVVRERCRVGIGEPETA